MSFGGGGGSSTTVNRVEPYAPAQPALNQIYLKLELYMVKDQQVLVMYHHHNKH